MFFFKVKVHLSRLHVHIQSEMYAVIRRQRKLCWPPINQVHMEETQVTETYSIISTRECTNTSNHIRKDMRNNITWRKQDNLRKDTEQGKKTYL